MKTLLTFKLVCLLLFINSTSIAQNDTLNRYNSNKKKDGFWICYLDGKLKKTDIQKAVYYGYDLFDNGRNLTQLGIHGMKVHSVSKPKEIAEKKNNPILLEGKFVLINKRGDEKSIEEYRNGYPYIFRGLSTYKNKKLIDFEMEYLDFTKKYQGEQGSFYYEERSTNLKDTTKYWIRRVDGKFKNIKIN